MPAKRGRSPFSGKIAGLPKPVVLGAAAIGAYLLFAHFKQGTTAPTSGGGIGSSNAISSPPPPPRWHTYCFKWVPYGSGKRCAEKTRVFQ